MRHSTMKIVLKPHICAYLDVLGGAEIFLSRNLLTAEFFMSSMLEFERRLNGMRRNDSRRRACPHDDCRRNDSPVVKTFTDNIFAAFPLSTTNKTLRAQQICLFLQEVANQIQHFFLESELFLRGAVTIGDMMIDDKFVFGPSVVAVVSAEKTAIYPRVVLDHSVLAELSESFQDVLVYRAADGVSSLNYLAAQFWMLRPHQKAIEKALLKYKNKVAIEAQYHWLQQYHNDTETHLRKFGL